jgi:hypothetical protein
MSTSADLNHRPQKSSAQMTYADLAEALGMAEVNVKRMLAKGDMPLSRIDAMCRPETGLPGLARRVTDTAAAGQMTGARARH